MNSNHYVLTNATIIDVEGESTFKGAVEIKNNQIEHIYNNDEAIAKDVEIIDLHGKYIMPGLIDMHCHIKDGFAPQFVASGVTTIRNTAGSLIELQRMIDLPPEYPTPRIYTADRMIDGPPGLWGGTSIANFVTDVPSKARIEVQRQAEAGAKFIKVYGWLSGKVMAAVADEARKHNLEVSCDLLHAREINALEAAKMGVTWFEHASGFAQALCPEWYPQASEEMRKEIDLIHPDKNSIEDLCRKMLRYNVKLCPTMVITDQIEKLPHCWNPDNQITETTIGHGKLSELWTNMSGHSEQLKKQIGVLNNFTKMVAKTYFDLGGTVVTGTDTPGGVWTFPGMALHRELEIFVEIGFSEMEALQAATCHAATSIHLNNVGVIKEDAAADLIILGSNPLEDIRNTQDIHRVIKGGKLFEQSEILAEIPSGEWLEERYQILLDEYEKVLGIQVPTH